MNRTEFQNWTKHHIRLMDGATGSNLMKAGMPRGVCTEQWVLEQPDAILALQSAYKAAGSDMVYAPTFCANRIALSGYGLQDDVSRMNRELVALSKKAVGSGVLVAGDMTTTGKPADPEDSDGYQQLLDAYREQAEALISGGADLIGVETMMGVNECVAAIEAIRSLGDIAVICTLSVQSDGKCYFDGSVFEAAEILEALGADAIGVNCSTGPDQLESVIRTLKNTCTLPIIAKPNAGMPKISDSGKAVYSMESGEFAQHMERLVEAGASLIGGCCGTTPEFIEALRGLKR